MKAEVSNKNASHTNSQYVLMEGEEELKHSGNPYVANSKGEM